MRDAEAAIAGIEEVEGVAGAGAGDDRRAGEIDAERFEMRGIAGGDEIVADHHAEPECSMPSFGGDGGDVGAAVAEMDAAPSPRSASPAAASPPSCGRRSMRRRWSKIVQEPMEIEVEHHLTAPSVRPRVIWCWNSTAATMPGSADDHRRGAPSGPI